MDPKLEKPEMLKKRHPSRASKRSKSSVNQDLLEVVINKMLKGDQIIIEDIESLDKD